MNNVKIFFSVIGILFAGIVLTVILNPSTSTVITPGKYDTFAQCLSDKGATFYGAFWCPHCQAQKKLFGNSARLLPYVECSTLDGKGQVQACTEKGVASYPTWEFADGSRLTGEISLEELAKKTSCALPLGDISPVLPLESGASS